MKRNTPLFSIITVCYNEEQTIEKTCKSVSAQTSKKFEWIVIDGKSTDKTLSILKKYKKNMSNLLSEKDKGVYDAMNKGISKANGKYLLFLNGGDALVDKNVLENASNLIKEDEEKSDIYYGDAIYDNGEVVDFGHSKLNKKFFKTKTISHQSTFINKNLFSKYGKYNLKYKIVADFDFWVKTIAINKVKTKHLPLIISIFDLAGISTNYKLANKQITERNKVLISYKIIGNTEKNIAELKWKILTMLKRAGLYNTIRRKYRKVIKR
jgi:glycosyltransferase involved in cell wall biosynthesis